MLIGQAKKDFEKWFLIESENERSLLTKESKKLIEGQLLNAFYFMSLSAKYGVYVDWFDSVNYKVYVMYNEVAHKWDWHIDFKPSRDDCNGYPQYTLNEARTEAIKKANEIYNSAQ